MKVSLARSNRYPAVREEQKSQDTASDPGCSSCDTGDRPGEWTGNVPLDRDRRREHAANMRNYGGPPCREERSWKSRSDGSRQQKVLRTKSRIALRRTLPTLPGNARQQSSRQEQNPAQLTADRPKCGSEACLRLKCRAHAESSPAKAAHPKVGHTRLSPCGR